jgi:hypothetical protein
MSQGNGVYNRAHDAQMTLQRQQAEELRRRQEHQAWLASLTPEQLSVYNEERRRLREEGQRAARIWAETTLNRRNRANVVSDEDERQQQQLGGGRRRKKRNTRKTKKTRKHKKTHRRRK